jgi:hypothetical protein
MIADIKIIDSIIQFFSRIFRSKKEQKREDLSLLHEIQDLLKELESTWTLPSTKSRDLVDYTNLLLEKSKSIRRRENRAFAREVRDFAQRNCYAGALPLSESERIQKETQDLLIKIVDKIEIVTKL